MDAEESWTARLFNSDVRRRSIDVEIKKVVSGSFGCSVKGCKGGKGSIYTVGKENETYGVDIELCSVHSDDDTALEIYSEEL